MIDTVIDHLLGTEAIDRVVFALFDEATYDAFHGYLLEKFSSKS
jgi:hypothetical protein